MFTPRRSGAASDLHAVIAELRAQLEILQAQRANEDDKHPRAASPAHTIPALCSDVATQAGEDNDRSDGCGWRSPISSRLPADCSSPSSLDDAQLSREELLSSLSLLRASHRELGTAHFLLQAQNADYLSQIDNLSDSIRSLQAVIDARSSPPAASPPGAVDSARHRSGISRGGFLSPHTPQSSRAGSKSIEWLSLPLPSPLPPTPGSSTAAQAHAVEIATLNEALQMAESSAQAAAQEAAHELASLRAELEAQLQEMAFALEGAEFARSDAEQQALSVQDEMSRERAKHADRVRALEAELVNLRNATQQRTAPQALDIASTSISAATSSSEAPHTASVAVEAELRSSLATAEAALAEQQAENGTLQQSLTFAQQERSSVAKALSDLQLEYQSAMASSAALQAEIDRLRLSAEQSTLEMQSHVDTVSRLQRQLADEQALAADRARKSDAIVAELRTHIEQHQAQLVQQRSDLQSAREQESQQHALVQRLRSELAEVRTQLDDARTKEAAAQAALVAAERQMAIRAGEIESLHADCDSLRLLLTQERAGASSSSSASEQLQAQATQLALQHQGEMGRAAEKHAAELAQVTRDAQIAADSAAREHQQALTAVNTQLQTTQADSKGVVIEYAKFILDQTELVLTTPRAAAPSASAARLAAELQSVQQKLSAAERRLARETSSLRSTLERKHGGDIAALRKEHDAEIAKLQDRISTIETEHATQVATLNASVAQHARDAETLREEISTLRTRAAEHRCSVPAPTAMPADSNPAVPEAHLQQEAKLLAAETQLHAAQADLRAAQTEVQQLRLASSPVPAAPEPSSDDPAVFANSLAASPSSRLSQLEYALSLARSELAAAQTSFQSQLSSVTRAVVSARTEAAFYRGSQNKLQEQVLTMGKSVAEAKEQTEQAEMERDAARKAGQTTAATLRQVQTLYESACKKLGQPARSSAAIAAQVQLDAAAAAVAAGGGAAASAGDADAATKLAEVQQSFLLARQKLAHYVKLLHGKDAQIAALQSALKKHGVASASAASYRVDAHGQEDASSMMNGVAAAHHEAIDAVAFTHVESLPSSQPRVRPAAIASSQNGTAASTPSHSRLAPAAPKPSLAADNVRVPAGSCKAEAPLSEVPTEARTPASEPTISSTDASGVQSSTRPAARSAATTSPKAKQPQQQRRSTPALSPSVSTPRSTSASAESSHHAVASVASSIAVATAAPHKSAPLVLPISSMFAAAKEAAASALSSLEKGVASAEATALKLATPRRTTAAVQSAAAAAPASAEALLSVLLPSAAPRSVDLQLPAPAVPVDDSPRSCTAVLLTRTPRVVAAPAEHQRHSSVEWHD